MGLNAFKGAGAAYAVDRLMATRPHGDRPVLVCASAGNHGRAVAHAGDERGLDVLVYMSAATAPGPRRAIEAEGARVVLIDRTYDEAVERATADAAARGPGRVGYGVARLRDDTARHHGRLHAHLRGSARGVG